MRGKLLAFPLLTIAAAGSSIALADRFSSPSSGELPQIQCDRFDCTLVPPSPNDFDPGAGLESPNPFPVTAAPPGGQRLFWTASCQNILTMSPQPTFAQPFEYIKAENVAVPLGSTHASLLASGRFSLGGTPNNSGGDVGFLQIKRSSMSTWENVQVAYAYTIPGGITGSPPILYGIGTFHGVENLSKLQGTVPGDSTGDVPLAIDVRFALSPQKAGAFQFLTNSVCDGRLELTF